MSVAFVFAGQGLALADYVREWCDQSVRVRTLVQEAADLVALPLRQLMRADGSVFGDTAVYQPVMTALSVGVLCELQASGVNADAVAGHSLGELAACVAAGSVSATAAVQLAATRGRCMARAAVLNPGGMLAVTVDPPSTIEDVLAETRGPGWAVVAAHNSTQHWVLSGSSDALRSVTRRFAPMALAMGGPWHSPAMQPAVAEFRDALDITVKASPRLAIICNHTGDVVQTAADLAHVLALQLTHRVAWQRSMQSLQHIGVRRVIIVGPGRPMRGLVRSNLPPDVSVMSVDRPGDLNTVTEALAA